VIYEELIPVSKGSSIQEAFTMGEDFELLFTMPKNEARRLLKRGLKIFKPIGEIVAGNKKIKLISQNGGVRPLKIKGYRHF
jgi:thiamine monophosphate kinase